MQLIDFLQKSSTDPFEGKYVVLFHRKKEAKGAVPSLFLATLFSRIKEQYPGSSLDVEDRSLPETMVQLRMSFLGSRLLYFVKNTHLLPLAEKRLWSQYLTTYEGPHCLLVYDSPRSPTETMLTIELPEKVDSMLYSLLFRFFHPEAPLDTGFVRKLFMQQPTITLEAAVTLMSYQTVIGKNADLFFKDWFARIQSPQKSLFQLSQYFFAQQPQQFFNYWKGCKEDYPEEFWVNYWSEQLWQAVLFISRAHTEGIESAKEQAYRLPFSFIERDWKRYTPQSLVNAHQFLYQFDYTLKNSIESQGLELMYHLFLGKKFS